MKVLNKSLPMLYCKNINFRIKFKILDLKGNSIIIPVYT